MSYPSRPEPDGDRKRGVVTILVHRESSARRAGGVQNLTLPCGSTNKSLGSCRKAPIPRPLPPAKLGEGENRLPDRPPSSFAGGEIEGVGVQRAFLNSPWQQVIRAPSGTAHFAGGVAFGETPANLTIINYAAVRMCYDGLGYRPDAPLPGGEMWQVGQCIAYYYGVFREY